MIQGQPAPPVELNLRGKGAGKVVVQLDSLRVSDAAGHPQVRTSLIDVTARRQAEKRLAVSYEQLRRTLCGTVQALSATVETRDPYICGHQRRVAKLSDAISQHWGFPRSSARHTGVGAAPRYRQGGGARGDPQQAGRTF